MGFLLLYPAIVALSLFILLAIIIVLRFGAGRCQLRHTSFSDRESWDDEQKINDVNSSESSSSSDHESDAREDSSSPTTTKRVKRKYNRKRSIKIVKKFRSEKKDVPCMFGEYVASEIRTIGSEFYSSRAKECIAAILSRAKTGRLGSHLLAVLSDFEEPLLPLPLLPPENESSEPGPSPIPMDNDEETAKEDRNSSDSESNDITGWLRAPSH